MHRGTKIIINTWSDYFPQASRGTYLVINYHGQVCAGHQPHHRRIYAAIQSSNLALVTIIIGDKKLCSLDCEKTPQVDIFLVKGFVLGFNSGRGKN
jgi:hypothetical protein